LEAAMTGLAKSYNDATVARRVAQDLSAAGVPERDIVLMIGRRVRDVRREPVGEFAGPIPPDAPVGTFGDRRVRRRQGAGTFAGDADRQRQGSFADADREVVIRHDEAGEHAHVGGHRDLSRVLRRRAVEPPARERILNELDAGRAVVLLELAGIAPDEVRSRLEDPPPAA
jgi:hypothetical protein